MFVVLKYYRFVIIVLLLIPAVAFDSSATVLAGQWSSTPMTLDSLDSYASRSEAALIRKFAKWVNSENILLRHYSAIYNENPALYNFLQYRMITSECMQIQAGDFPEIILKQKEHLISQEHDIESRLDSVFAIAENARIWEELGIVCGYVMNSARDFLDSVTDEHQEISMSFNFGSLYAGGVSSLGDPHQRAVFLDDFEVYYADGYPANWSGMTEMVKTNRALQFIRSGPKLTAAAVPISDDSGNVLGEVVLRIERRTSDRRL